MFPSVRVAALRVSGDGATRRLMRLSATTSRRAVCCAVAVSSSGSDDTDAMVVVWLWMLLAVTSSCADDAANVVRRFSRSAFMAVICSGLFSQPVPP